MYGWEETVVWILGDWVLRDFTFYYDRFCWREHVAVLKEAMLSFHIVLVWICWQPKWVQIFDLICSQLVTSQSSKSIAELVGCWQPRSVQGLDWEWEFTQFMHNWCVPVESSLDVNWRPMVFPGLAKHTGVTFSLLFLPNCQ